MNMTELVMLVSGTAASNNPFSAVATPVVQLINMAAGPLLMIVGALGTLYCVILGVKLAKAEEPQEREKAKAALKNAIIGFIIIFVLITALNVMMDPLMNWMNTSAKTNISVK